MPIRGRHSGYFKIHNGWISTNSTKLQNLFGCHFHSEKTRHKKLRQYAESQNKRYVCNSSLNKIIIVSFLYIILNNEDNFVSFDRMHPIAHKNLRNWMWYKTIKQNFWFHELISFLNIKHYYIKCWTVKNDELDLFDALHKFFCLFLYIFKTLN